MPDDGAEDTHAWNTLNDNLLQAKVKFSKWPWKIGVFGRMKKCLRQNVYKIMVVELQEHIFTQAKNTCDLLEIPGILWSFANITPGPWTAFKVFY